MTLRAIIAASGCALLVSCVATDAGKTELAPETPDFSKPSQTVWPTLSTFTSQSEFEHYFRTVAGQLETPDTPWYESDGEGAEPVPVPVAPPPPPPPPPPMPSPPPTPGSALADAAPMAEPSATVTVTGSAIADDANPSITNTQEAGVDEGDIVKQIGHYLIVMQDGRLFSVDLMPDGEPGLRFVDRENVYTTAEEDTWYDEMLVFGRQMIVIGYSYDADTSVFAVLDLEDDGSITFRDRFFLPAQDYYDGDNYTTRLVNGQLALHTSFYLADADSFAELNAPALSRTMAPSDKHPLDAQKVYRPLQDASDPLLHAITLCPLRDLSKPDAEVPECRTTAFIASDSYEYYASQDAVWLWVNEADERWWVESDDEDDSEKSALLYSIPYGDQLPGVAKVQGTPVNQFSLAADTDVFRAFVEIDTDDADGEQLPASPYRLLQLPRDAITTTPVGINETDYTVLPDAGTDDIENRFTGTHFVYTVENPDVPFWQDEQSQPATSRLAVVPLDDPASPTLVELRHNVIRLERARDYIVATGYEDQRGLSLSSLDLREESPRVGGQLTLLSRYESENRSHAFNSSIDSEGEGLIGLPTVLQQWEAGRWVWRSESSDLSYISVASDASLGSVGTLKGADGKPHEGYECEVSCIDWYGNSRPIFTMGRIFALSGTSVVEGQLEAQRGVSEIRRVDLTAPVSNIVAD